MKRALLYILMGLVPSFVWAAPNPRFARIARISGPACLLRYGVDNWEDAAMNMVVSEGDRIRTEDSYLEIQFDNGVTLNLDEDTDIELTDLGRDEVGEELTSIYIVSGRARIDVPRYYNAERRFYIETPDAFIALEERARAQIEAPNGRSRIILYTGRARVVSDVGEVSLLAGEYTLVEKGKRPAHPKRYRAIYDSFDRWCETQKEYEGVSRKYVPDVIIGVEELDRHGRWVYVGSYGWVWRPRVRFGWRPYYYGHWAFNARYGWTWVSYESWGWVPYHYGRWAYHWPYGWVWIPGRVWGPCWVCWSYGPNYIWWSPMGPGDYPWFYASSRCFYVDRWVCVDKYAFKNYKYKHYRGKYNKPYRRSYKYSGKLPGDLKWKKDAPDIRTKYVEKLKPAENRAITSIKATTIKRNVLVPELKRESTRRRTIPVPGINKETIKKRFTSVKESGREAARKQDTQTYKPAERIEHKTKTFRPEKSREKNSNPNKTKSKSENKTVGARPRANPPQADLSKSASGGPEQSSRPHRIDTSVPASRRQGGIKKLDKSQSMRKYYKR